MKKIQLLQLIFLPAVFILLVSFGFWGLRSSIDPDFGWHIKTGQLILERGVPYKDWYSFTMPDFPWIDHEWLTDILLYKIYSIFGNDFLLLIFLSIHGLAFLTIKNKSQKLSAFLLAFVFGYLATIGFLGIRPQVITVFLIAVLWKTINKFLDEASVLVYFLPFLFVLWANLHGGFFAGLVILAMALALEIFKKIKVVHKIKFLNTFALNEHSWRKILILFFIFLVSFLATIANPYGIRIYDEVFRTAGDNFLRRHISEWIPLFSTGFNVLTTIYIGMYVGLLIMFYKRVEFNHLAVSLFFFFLAISSARHFLIFSVVACPVIGDIFSKMRFRENLAKTISALNFFQKREAALVAMMILLLFFYGFYYNFLKDFLNSVSRDTYPKKAVSFLKTLPPSDNLLNEYGWGGYLIWKLPERKYFIDGRMPSWRENGQFAFGDYIKIYDAEEEFEDTLQKYDVKLALLSKDLKNKSFENKNSPFNNFLKKHKWLVYIFRGTIDKEKNLYKELTILGWQNIYEDDTAIILKK